MGSGPPKNHKNIGFLSNTGLEKSQSHQSRIQCWAIIGPPAKRRFAGGPMMVRFECYSDSLSPYTSPPQKKKILDGRFRLLDTFK